jgi:transcriptional regulator with XRE-family HTH domain
VTFKSILPRRMVRFRELHNLSVTQLANDTGVAVSTLRKIEFGFARGGLRVDTLLAICKRFRVSSDVLLGFDLDSEHTRSMLSTQARLDHYAAINTHAAMGVERKCGVCDRLLVVNEAHTQGQCIMLMHERGHARDLLASKFGLTLTSIDKIVRDEYEILRTRGAGGRAGHAVPFARRVALPQRVAGVVAG